MQQRTECIHHLLNLLLACTTGPGAALQALIPSSECRPGPSPKVHLPLPLLRPTCAASVACMLRTHRNLQLLPLQQQG